MTWPSISNAINYAYDNPITRSAISISKSALNAVYPGQGSALQPPIAMPNIILQADPLWQLAVDQGPLVRAAGISGALAMGLAAYGAHKSYPKDRASELKAIYETGNRIHLVHSVALLATPLCKHPKLSGMFFVAGILLFCGPCYVHAFTGENKGGKLAPFGGFCFILGWLTMIK